MKVSNVEQIFGSESPPVLHESNIGYGGKGASSAREMHRIRWNAIRAQQAAGSNNATAYETFPEEVVHKESFDAKDPVLGICNTQLDVGRSSNLHSQPCTNKAELDSSEEEDSTDVHDSGHLNHKTRISNLSDYEQEPNSRIDFPSGNNST